MSPTGSSWHVPYIFKTGSHVQNPNQTLWTVFLQRMSEEATNEVMESLKEIDEDWISKLGVPRPPTRVLEAKKWIRDYWPSSNVILSIAEHAYDTQHDREPSYQSLIFVDSGWEAGNVIAARWETIGDERRFNAVRVSMNIAKTLLAVCDANEGYDLAHVLGSEVFEESKVDFYVDRTQSNERPKAPVQQYALPDFLPDNLSLSKEQPFILSLRTLDQQQIDQLLGNILCGNQDDKQMDSVKMINWQGPYPTRTDIHRIYCRIRENTAEESQDMPLFLVDALLEGKDGQPQLLMARQASNRGQQAIQVIPIHTGPFLEFWQLASQGSVEENTQETDKYADIWSSEYTFDSSVHKSFAHTIGAPVFFLHPFSVEEERIVRFNLRELNDIDKDEYWGREWTFYGYLWQDEGKKHTIHDLRDLFESCDPFSPSYDPKQPGPYKITAYPHHFACIDWRIFDREPKVILASSLDFHGEDVSDELGWTYGLIDAKDFHLNYVNLDIANMGPEEMINEPQKLWLSDLKEYKPEWEEWVETV